MSLVYTRAWNEAPLGIQSPYNDIRLLGLLKTYPNRIVGSKASRALGRHLWFLSEHLVALAFFDDRVSSETKLKMVQNLQRPRLPDTPRRVQLTDITVEPRLENFVTERTSFFFDVLAEEGKAKAKTFMEKSPDQWEQDGSYTELRDRAARLKVVNDTAERGIALMQTYNQTLTKDETQKQLLLRIVAEHRKQIPQPTKSAIMS